MARLLHIAGTVLLAAAIIVIVAGHAFVVASQGWGALADSLSPFNVVNYAMMIAALLPGLVLRYLAGRISE